MNRMSGTTVLYPIFIDYENFSGNIIEVLEATEHKQPHAKRIRIIADGLGAHGVGKHGQRCLDNSLKDAPQWVSSVSVFYWAN